MGRMEIMEYNELSEEKKAKARACATPEEVLALAKEEGYELSDEELAAVAGGGVWGCDDYVNKCPNACLSDFYC